MPRVTKRQRVLAFAAGRGWNSVGGAEWTELRAALPDISEHILRHSGLALEYPWRGVVQDSLENLEQSLRALGEIYAAQPQLAALCRSVVITAKDHARLASKNARTVQEKRDLKAEMVEWMLVWLGDPAVFPVWATLRRRLKSEIVQTPD